jgi:hypothetical protein
MALPGTVGYNLVYLIGTSAIVGNSPDGLAVLLYPSLCSRLKETSIMDAVQLDTFGLRINRDVCFTTHNNKFHEGMANRQLKVLRDLVPTLKQVLKPDEEILLAVKATSPMSLFEQLVTGWIIHYLKRCVLVFTNKRILHFPTKINKF